MAYEEFDPREGDVYLTHTSDAVKEKYGDLAKDYGVVLLAKHAGTGELGVEFAGTPGWHPLALLFGEKSSGVFYRERIYRKDV